MDKAKQKRLEEGGWKIGTAYEFIGIDKHRLKPASLELSYADMALVSSWFLGYDLGHVQLIERECKRITGKKWGYERIMQAFKAGKIGSPELKGFIEAASAHKKKSLKLRNRMWADFKKNQPKRRKKKK